MKKRFIIGCILVIFILMLLPSSSVAESNSVEKRLELKEFIENQIEEIPIIKENSEDPTIILRLLLILRNIFLLCVIGVVGIILAIRNIINRIFNISATPV
jgi:hypothetical protein